MPREFSHRYNAYGEAWPYPGFPPSKENLAVLGSEQDLSVAAVASGAVIYTVQRKGQ
jgi:hypothetical protein